LGGIMFAIPGLEMETDGRRLALFVKSLHSKPSGGIAELESGDLQVLLCAACNRHKEDIEVSEMIRDVSDCLAVGRYRRRELVSRSVGQCDRFAAGARNAVEFTVTLAVDDDGGINGAGSVGQRGNGMKLRDVREAIRGERKL